MDSGMTMPMAGSGMNTRMASSVMSTTMASATAMASAAATTAANAMNSNYLTTDGYNLSNATDQMTFWGALLDDSAFVPVDEMYSAYFWYGISIVIGIATFINFSSRLTLRARLRAAAVNRPYPAKPGNPYTKFQAFMTAVVREVTYPQYTLAKFSSMIKPPPTGIIFLLSLYFGFLVGLELVQNFIPGALSYQAFGLRAGWLSITQLPLLILLVGKQNLIGFFTGLSYERLNVFHRWVARSIWLCGLLHWAFMQYAWTEYGVEKLEISTDPAYPTGIAAWAVLTWICFSSAAPFRNWQYEIFVIQHVLSFIAFFVVILMHVPVTYAKTYVYIPIGLFVFDRLVRSAFFAYNNSRLGRATLTALPGGVTKVQVRSLRLKNWHAGQHVLLSLPRFGILQSHPATILSTPASHNGDLIFILKAHKGFTRRLNIAATSRVWPIKEISRPSTASRSNSFEQVESAQPQLPKYLALVSGPFGSSHSDFACFSSALFVAASTGITFTLPLLLNIAERAQTTNLPLRHISFVWIVKSSHCSSWVSEELRAAMRNLNQTRITCEVNIFVTSNTELAQYNTVREKAPACHCTTPNGFCYCNRDVPPPLPSKYKRSIADGVRPVPTRSDSGASQPMTVRAGRPNIEQIIWEVLEGANGETGIAVCGPLDLGVRCRKAVSGISTRRGVHKGTGAQGVYLHVEGFSW